MLPVARDRVNAIGAVDSLMVRDLWHSHRQVQTWLGICDRRGMAASCWHAETLGIFQVTATLGALVSSRRPSTTRLCAPGAARRHPTGGTVTAGRGVGIVSLILWALILIISVNTPFSSCAPTTTAKRHVACWLAVRPHAPPGTWRAGLLVVGLVAPAALRRWRHHAGDFRSQPL